MAGAFRFRSPTAVSVAGRGRATAVHDGVDAAIYGRKNGPPRFSGQPVCELNAEFAAARCRPQTKPTPASGYSGLTSHFFTGSPQTWISAIHIRFGRATGPPPSRCRTRILVVVTGTKVISVE